MAGRYRVTRILEWDAAHRVMRHESKCSNLHGHRYRAEITCSAPRLDHVGRVVDFGCLKEIVGAWVDEFWDHNTILNSDDTQLIALLDEDLKTGPGRKPPYVFNGTEPTAENIAFVLFEVATKLLGQAPADKVDPDVIVEKVRVYETPNCYAEWPGE